MNTKFVIKNFRVFDEDGVTFDIRPLTILTGCNSSGKSSVVKAVLLLNSFLGQVKKSIQKEGNNIPIDKMKLDFSVYPFNLLGRFDKTLHNGSDNRTVTFEYTVRSLMLSKDVTVTWVFAADDKDALNNGYLIKLVLSTSEGTFYSTERCGNTYCNLNLIKGDYLTFILIEYAINRYCNNESAYEFEGSVTKADYEKTRHETIEYLKSVEKTKYKDVLRYIRTHRRHKEIVQSDDTAAAMNQQQEYKSIFHIPVVDSLFNVKKNEFGDYVTSKFLTNASKGLLSASQKVIRSYIASECENFTDFVNSQEEKYLEHVSCKGDFVASKGLHLLSSFDLSLDTGEVSINPYDTQSVRLFDDENVDEKSWRQKEIEEFESAPLSFAMLYEVVMEWNKVIAPDGKGLYQYIEPSFHMPIGGIVHTAYELLTVFAENLVREVCCPDWSDNIPYVSSSRASVNRLYTLDNKDDFTLLLRDYLEAMRVYAQYKNEVNTVDKRDYVANDFTNKWLRKFGVGETISVDTDKEGLGVQIRIHQQVDDEGHLLADEGYGITQLVSMLLQIETAILVAKNYNKQVNRIWGLNHLDKYDVNKFHYAPRTIAIEEPEIHLHPNYQSLLSEMFAEAYVKYNIHFIIETHSEYLIRKLQTLVLPDAEPDYKVQPGDVTILYINDADVSKRELGEPHLKQINIRNNGYLDGDFGTGFFDETIKNIRTLQK